MDVGHFKISSKSLNFDLNRSFRYLNKYIKGYHLNAAPSLNTQTVVYDESGFVTASSGPLDAFVMVPATPRQVWAGSETLFLKFKNEAEAKKALADYWIEPTIGEA